MRGRKNEIAEDEETNVILYKGANLRQLARLFALDHENLKRHLVSNDCRPSGVRNGTEIYKVSEVAPFLIKPGYSVEEYIKTMHPSELPKMLTKEFWAAMKSRQDYDIKDGNLWPTDMVIEKVGEIFKIVKSAARTAADQVEAQVELTPAQRKILRGLMDSMMAQISGSIKENFKVDTDNGHADEDEEM